jgi:hypothetical protein
MVEEGAQAYPVRVLELMFWKLRPDAEHPPEAQRKAWSCIDRATGGITSRPVDWYMEIVQLLREMASESEDRRRDVLELARYWSLPELFERSSVSTSRILGYHEIHCHFRGAVPFEALWVGWLKNERWRASLRTERVVDGSWETSWAELIRQVLKRSPTIVRKLSRSSSGGQREENTEEERERWIRLAEAALVRPRFRPAIVPYLATCTGLRRTLICQRAEAGLSLFAKRYKRYSKVQKAGHGRTGTHTEDLVVAVLERFEAEGAVAVELRPTFERSRIEIQKKLSEIVRGYLRYLRGTQKPLKLGLVPSLFKQEALPEGVEPDTDTWKRQATIWQHQVMALLEVIRTVPALRYFVVGIDAAGKERGCPSRALAGAFQVVHRYHRDVGVWNARPGRRMLPAERLCGHSIESLNQRDWEPVRLGLTVHAGEDFVDPLTGLRHVAEAIEALGLRRGDRLGHALALALTSSQVESLLRRRAGHGEVESTANGGYRILKPRGEHLLDLAWAMEEVPAGEERLIATLLARDASGVFGSPTDAVRFAQALRGSPHVEAWIPAVRYADGKGVVTEDRLAILVDGDWRSLLQVLRARMIVRVAAGGIVVESCPTSNCAVANLRRAPLLDLLEEAERLHLRVAVATDDPALLGAWPSDELARVPDKHRDRVLHENAMASFVW